MAEKQADCDFKDEQVKVTAARAEKAENEALSMQGKMAESDSTQNHMRRIMHSIREEKSNLEAKVEALSKEKERQANSAQNLKSQCLDLQLSISKLQTERDELAKALNDSEAEKSDIIGKFDQYGAHLQD